jgi:linoleoyl-CoA desaturase
MGIGMAGVGMNVNDGNHGSYSNKTGSINSWVVRFIFLQETCNWQVQHNVLHHTYTNIPGHDEDLDAGRIIRFKRGKMAFFPSLPTILCFMALTFNWAITTDFRQMKTYLKKKSIYGEAKSQKHFGRL